jgi:hypothetical protein
MKKLIQKTAVSELSQLTDKQLSLLSFSMPWQEGAINEDVDSGKDADGFSSADISSVSSLGDRETLQRTLWKKFNSNPYVGTAVRGQVGRLTGLGFEISSEIFEINEAIEENEFDPRNRLYMMWSKYAGRAIIEGELFLCLTVHPDGFIETDFIDPSNITGGGEDGILYHPNKATLPMYYFVTPPDVTDKVNGKFLVPSIFLAYYPDLIKIGKNIDGFTEELVKDSKGGSKYSKIGNYKRFIVSWDRSFVTRRNVSSLRTVLEWLNHYENLKKYEIDHKKSAGAYLWVLTMEDPKAFRTWLSLTDDERRKTGIMAKKTPGGTLILPPGMKLEAQAPKLPTISEGDTDILHMVTGGLNEPEDVSTGQSKGTFASVKASRGPMSDRMSDEIAYFDRFLKFEYYRAVFFLKSKVSGFPETFSIRTATKYDKKKEPVFENIKRKPEFLIDISYPTSEVIDAESRARAYLGVKHGSLYDTIGVPFKEIAKKLGFGNYPKLRLAYEVEKDKYPEMFNPVDAGGEQLDPNKRALQKKNNQQVIDKKQPIVKKPIVK